MNGGAQDPLPEAFLVPGGLESLRSLSEHGVPVTPLCQGAAGPIGASRFVERVLICPRGWGATMDRWFAAQPWPQGGVVMPASDDSAWWLAGRECSGHVRCATPGLPALRTLLAKGRLYEVCAAAGVAAPRTWLAREGAALPEGQYPLMVKPQMRVGMQHWTRGRLVRNRGELAQAVDWFRRSVSFRDDLTALEPDVSIPLVQEYVVRPRHEVYHLAGYRSRAGESVFAAHRKILQYPLRFGSGLCFESAEVDQGLAEGLERLLAAAQFHGIFEAEYVERDGEKLLIDLNPRTYNGISLETRRGYALPWYLYLDAIGEQDRLSEELSRARALKPPDLVWRDGMRFWTMLAGQSLSGGMKPKETWQWIRWSRRNRRRLIDPQFTRADLKPGFVALRGHAVSAVTAPRDFLGTYVRRGLDR